MDGFVLLVDEVLKRFDFKIAMVDIDESFIVIETFSFLHYQ